LLLIINGLGQQKSRKTVKTRKQALFFQARTPGFVQKQGEKRPVFSVNHWV
jgi:hypothetical protein